MTQYVPEGEAVGEGVEVPLNDASIEEVRDVAGGTSGAEQGGSAPDVDAGPVDAPVEPTDEQAPGATTTEDLRRQLVERTEDLQRVQAEYVNYKRRVDRDRDHARAAGVGSVVGDLLPILDAIALAEQHGELTGGFKAVADELEKLAAKHGLEAYGEAGDPFDPQVHDGLMMVPGTPGQTEPLVGEVLQRGYRANGRILRHARVSVSEPGA